MRPRHLLVAAMVAFTACASVPEPDPSAGILGPRGDTRTLTAADLANATQIDLADLIATERPQWLRGADGRPAPVLVYVGDTRMGGPAALRDLTVKQVAYVHYYDATAARQRFSARDLSPVIQVILRQ